MSHLFAVPHKRIFGRSERNTGGTGTDRHGPGRTGTDRNSRNRWDRIGKAARGVLYGY